MILNLPKIGLVRFRDDLSEAELDGQLERLSKKYDFEIPRGQLTTGEMFSKSLSRGAKQLGSTFGDVIPAMGASALGFDEYAARQMEEAQDTQREINKYYAPQYRDTGDIKGIGDLPGFALETITEQVPNIATALVPGGIGGTIARRAGVAAAERAAMPLIESGATAAELARVAGRTGAEYATRGQNLGVFLGSYAQNAPEVFQNIYEKTGELAPGAAMLFGTASAALDSVLPAQLLKSVTGPVKVGIIEKLLERSGMDKGLLRSVSAGMLKGTGAESLTEGMQEAISIAAENFVDKHEAVFGSKEWNRIMESAVRGAVAGGAFGGVGGGAEAFRAGQERKGQYAQAMGQRQQRLLAGEVGRQSADIEAFGADQQQMQLPGFEIGPASGLLPPAQPTPPVVKEPKGKQLGLFGDEGLPTKEAEASKLRGDKAVANQERLAQQRESAEVKTAQAKLKAAIGELINTPTDLVGLAKQPSPLSQTIAQAQGDLDALASKRGPKAEAIPEPKVVQKATPLTPQQLPTTINDEVLKGLGIGHTAILRKNKLLEGKDISKPADAAEVKRILEAYAENRSEPIRQKIEVYLSRPEFQGAQDVAGLNAKPSGGSASVDGGSDLVTPAETDAGLKRDGDVYVEPDAGDIDARKEQQPRTLTERQQRIAFGKSLGAAQSYPGMLRGRANIAAQTAAKNGNFAGVVAALEKSKNATVAEIARRAKALKTKIQIDDTAGETYEGRSAFEDQMSIDGAKMHLDALNKIRELVPIVEQLPDGAALPYAIANTRIDTYSDGKKHYSQLNLSNIVDNNNSMFSGLGLPEKRALRTKEDFKTLADAFERITQELGENKLRLTSTASSIQQGVAGQYSADTDTIYVPEYFAKDESVLAHEIVHAQVLNAVANPTKEQKPTVERLNKLYEHVKKIVEERAETDKNFRSPYGITSQQEFIAEGLSNPDFQYLLSRISYENTSVWDKFVETIAKLLGLKNDNALTELLTVYSDLTKGADVGIETSETIEATQEGQTQSVAGEPLSKKAATDEKKAEKGASADTQERRTFVRAIDKLVDNLITSEIRKAEKAANLNTGEVQLPTTFVGTDIHDLLRLPRLLSEFIRLQEVIPKIEEAPQRAKNEKAFKQIAEGINRSGVFAKEAMGALNGGFRNDPEALLGVLNKAGTESLADFVSEKIEAAKQEVAARRKEDQPPEPKKSTNQLSKTRLKRAINEVYHNWTRSNKQRAVFEEMVNQGKGLEAIDQVLESLDPESRQNLKSELNFIYGQEMFLPKAIGPALDADGRALAEKGNFKDLLSHIINKTDNKLVRQILRKVQSLGIAPKIVIGDVGRENHAGVYDPATNTITLDPDFGLNHHTIIHETVHAAISHVLRSPNNKLTQAFVKFFEQIKNQMGSAYGGQDIQEFASELVGNPEFQALLKTIKAPRSENMFVNMMQAIAEFLGFRNAYKEGMKFVNDAIDISSKVEVTPAEKMFLSMGSAVNSAFNTVGQIGQNMPSLAGQTLEDTKNLFSNVKDFGWMKTAMGMLRLDNINTLYKKELPSIQKLIDALELRNGMQEQRISAINKDYKRFSDIAKANSQAMKRMDDMAIDARLYEVDPLDANFKTTPANAAQYHRLRNIYTSLPSDVQTVYRDIRNFYTKSLNEYEQLLLRSVSPSLAAKLTQEFATRKKLTAYIPFLRSGDFWLEFADPATGERAAMAFESIRERQQFVDTILKPQNIQSKSYRNLQNILFDPSSIPATTFVGKIMADLKDQGASQQQLDSVYQAYLTLFPAESIAKQFLKSKNVLGMERDIVKGYGTTAVKWARKLSSSEYAPQIDKALGEIQAQAENVNRLDVTAAAENIMEQKEFLHNPTFNAFTQAATTLSYFEYIAGNISSALINITSLPMLVWPILGGKFGFDKTTSAMTAASRVAINGMEKDARYKKLYETMMNHGQLEHTMAREVLEGRRQKTTEFTGLKGRILDGLSIPFAATERYNRATTAIAAYDLARQSGMSEADAIQYAVTTTKDVHTSGLAATAPKWMQNPVGRVFFTFKSFVWNSAFIMARAFHQAFKGETPAIQHAARRQLLGTYGMAMAFGGVKGMPFYGAISTFATMIQALFGDDDEPFDFNEEMRDFFGELGYKGAFNYVTNLELSNRVGIATDLIFRDDPRGVAEHGYILSAMQQMFGPAGSYAVSVGNGINMIKEGNVERGVEAIMPSFVRNGMKGIRYMSEGALTLKGDPVDEDINAYNSLMQAIGFSPADLSSNYEKTSAAKSYEKEVGARRVRLLNLHDMAKTAGDMDLMAETKDAISEFNDKHPNSKITGDTLRKSESSRKAAEKNMINGVTFNKKLRGEIEEKFFEEE